MLETLPVRRLHVDLDQMHPPVLVQGPLSMNDPSSGIHVIVTAHAQTLDDVGGPLGPVPRLVHSPPRCPSMSYRTGGPPQAPLLASANRLEDEVRRDGSEPH